MLKIAFKLMVNKSFVLLVLNMLDFKSYERQIKLPFMIYADLKVF